MLRLKPIDYDLLRIFVYSNNSLSLRCNNVAIIKFFSEVLTGLQSDYSVFMNNWIIVRNESIKVLALIIRLCNENAIEYEVR